MSNFLYVIRAENGLLKIGISQDPKKRLSSLQVGSPIPLELIYTMPEATYDFEKHVHKALRDYRKHGEWFDLGNCSDVVEFIFSLVEKENTLLRMAKFQDSLPWNK